MQYNEYNECLPFSWIYRYIQFNHKTKEYIFITPAKSCQNKINYYMSVAVAVIHILLSAYPIHYPTRKL